MACQNCESVALTMTSTRLPAAGAFAFALVEVGTNRRATRTPTMKVTRAIAATVESVKGVLKNLDIPYSLFVSCLYRGSQRTCINYDARKSSRLRGSLHQKARDERGLYRNKIQRNDSCRLTVTRRRLSGSLKPADFMHERE